MKPILKKLILPAGTRLPDELERFERADDFKVENVRTREAFLRALGSCTLCGKGFDEDGFFLDVFGEKYCPACYERATRRPN